MDIKKIIADYSPSPETIALLEKTKVVILCGITGAGKNAIQDELLRGDGYTRIVTSTTRAPRENDGVMEQDGREYYFFTQEQALQRIEQKKYFEVAYVHEKINGVTLEEVNRVHSSGKTAITNIDYQGVEYFHKHVPSVLAIFVVPPSYAVWYVRMRNRYDTEEDFQAALPARVQSAVKELEWALATDYLRFVMNDKLEDAINNTQEIIEGSTKSTGGRAQAQTLLDDMKQLAL